MAKWGPTRPEWRAIGDAPEGADLLLGCWVETGAGRSWSWWRSAGLDGTIGSRLDPKTGAVPTHFLSLEDLPEPPAPRGVHAG